MLTLPLMVWMAWGMITGSHGHSGTITTDVVHTGEDHTAPHLSGSVPSGPVPLASVLSAVLAAVLSTLVVLWPGWRTLRGAWRSLLIWSPTMDVLIATGATASILTGFVALADLIGLITFTIPSFAPIGAMIMAFHLTGRHIEEKARGRASQAIRRLLSLTPRKATRIRNGLEEVVPVEDLNLGDTLLIRPGEAVPADGEIIDGASSLDEQLITGESRPVYRSGGEAVTAGTMNLEGALRIRVRATGEDTFLQKVIDLVQKAQMGRIPAQELADRAVAVFVPVLLAIATLTFLLWALIPEWMDGLSSLRSHLSWLGLPEASSKWETAFFATLAVLVIACPCALGLATPVALMVGIGSGASNGILYRKGEAIQRLAEAGVFIFDKTGTLTTGILTVRQALARDTERGEFSPMQRSEASARRDTDTDHTDHTDTDHTDARQQRVMELIRRAEAPSEHPAAKAVVRFVDQWSGSGTLGVGDGPATKGAEEPGAGIQFEAVPGKGVRALVDGRQIRVGTRRFLTEEGVDLSAWDAWEAEASQSAPTPHDVLAASQTHLLASIDGRLEVVFAVEDEIKEDAKAALRILKEQGMRTVLLSGDRREVAEHVARQAGVDEVIAEVLPADKERIVRELQAGANGRSVVMVGDGINDAPALARADVGIALGTGTDIAIESSSVVLTRGEMMQVVNALDLSRATLGKIRQNLFWASIYNLVMIPLAMAALMHPLLAEAAMALSSLSVIANSRRLRPTKRTTES